MDAHGFGARQILFLSATFDVHDISARSLAAGLLRCRSELAQDTTQYVAHFNQTLGKRGIEIFSENQPQLPANYQYYIVSLVETILVLEQESQF